MISVVIPCYNEARRLPDSLKETIRFLERFGEPWEIVVVDDGSRDGTAEAARVAAPDDSRIRVIAAGENHGKGWAVREGLRASRGELVAFTDADLATPIRELGPFLAKAGEGYDLVIASRVLPGARIPKAQPFRRRAAGAIFRGLVRTLGLSRFSDTQCGFKLMRRATVGPVLDRVETLRFAFDVELLFRAERAGLAIAELPVEWHDRAGSQLRLYPDAIRMARDLVWMRRRLRNLGR